MHFDNDLINRLNKFWKAKEDDETKFTIEVNKDNVKIKKYDKRSYVQLLQVFHTNEQIEKYLKELELIDKY